MSDMLSYEAVQLKKLLAEEKDIRNRYISAAEEISDPQLKEKLQKMRRSTRQSHQRYKRTYGGEE